MSVISQFEVLYIIPREMTESYITTYKTGLIVAECIGKFIMSVFVNSATLAPHAFAFRYHVKYLLARFTLFIPALRYALTVGDGQNNSRAL